MSNYSSDIAFSPAVKAWQTAKGSRDGYRIMEESGSWRTEVDAELTLFLGTLDMFYLGTSNTVGQPYIQYRGGPKGFLKVLDKKTLAFAEFAGNRQFITSGNLSENPRAFIFLMDYSIKRRAKLWGHAEVVENDQQLLEQLHDPDYSAKIERVIKFTIDVWDGNCRQHIQNRIAEEAVKPVIAGLHARIEELENELVIVKTGR